MTAFSRRSRRRIKDTGLTDAIVEDLMLKFLSGIGSESGRAISDNVCLPMAILEDRFTALRQRQEIAPSGSAMLGDHIYRLTEYGPRPGASGAAGVCLCRPGAGAAGRLHQLGACADDRLGAAAEAAAGEGVCGHSRRSRRCSASSGRRSTRARACSSTGRRATARRRSPNGSRAASARTSSSRTRSSRAARSSRCSTPRATRRCGTVTESLFRTAEFDRRWIRIERPTVVVGGELTMDTLELKHDPVSNVSEASLQLKSNCGCLLIDDFGRQRINPTELLESLDHSAGESHRLLDALERAEDRGAVRAVDHLLDEPGAARPGGRCVPAADSVQGRGRRSVAGGVSPAVPDLCQEASGGVPAGDGGLSDAARTTTAASGRCGAATRAISWSRSSTSARTTRCRRR